MLLKYLLPDCVQLFNNNAPNMKNVAADEQTTRRCHAFKTSSRHEDDKVPESYRNNC